jgi:hypothetical protein
VTIIIVDWLNGFYLLAGVITIVSLIVTLVAYRRSDRRKILVCDISPPISLITILPDRTGHRFSVVYEREGSEPKNIKGACLYFVRLANFGREPIRREDLATSDVLRLEVEHAKVLDIAEVNVSRPVIGVGLSPLKEVGFFEEPGAPVTRSDVSFDFLDYQDGALIRILAESAAAKIVLRGTIIGMPEGIHHVDELRGRDRRRSLRLLLVLSVVVLLLVGAIATVPTPFFEEPPLQLKLSSSLSGAILLVISVFALTFMVLSATWVNAPRDRWPRSLSLPDWFVSHYDVDRMGLKTTDSVLAQRSRSRES